MSRPRVACTVLAAGASRRLGFPKQLVQIQGEPLVRRAARTCCASDCFNVSVVVGAYAPLVTQALRGLPVQVLTNLAWRQGMSSSIRCAARWAARLRCDALLVALCDQPRLAAWHINALLSGFERTWQLVASRYGAKRAAPVVFPACYFEGLIALTGDTGAKRLVRDAPDALEVEWPDGAADVDSVAQLNEFALGSRAGL